MLINQILTFVDLQQHSKTVEADHMSIERDPVCEIDRHVHALFPDCVEHSVLKVFCFVHRRYPLFKISTVTGPRSLLFYFILRQTDSSVHHIAIRNPRGNSFNYTINIAIVKPSNPLFASEP